MTNDKKCALRTYLNSEGNNVSYSEIEDTNDEDTYEYSGEEYLVVDDEDADYYAREYIEQSLWTFNAEFIIDYTDLPYDAIDMIRAYQDAEYEGCNDTIYALIADIDGFVSDAITEDGRGHFISQYDGEEIEQGEYFIYRKD